MSESCCGKLDVMGYCEQTSLAVFEPLVARTV
jgi:hypothetical protein